MSSMNARLLIPVWQMQHFIFTLFEEKSKFSYNIIHDAIANAKLRHEANEQYKL
jgi:hypothetical protein